MRNVSSRQISGNKLLKSMKKANLQRTHHANTCPKNCRTPSNACQQHFFNYTDYTVLNDKIIMDDELE